LTAFNNSSILITGGTGSFGRALVHRLLLHYPSIKRIAVYSRDELKQWEMQNELGSHHQLRFFLGDIRDRARFTRALEGIDFVVHAAALKQVPAAEYNPMEFINTNVLGAENVVQACLDSNVSRVIALSTDKAAAPVNLYGATKLCSDKLFIAANNVKGARNLRFSVVRYGNVMGSRGSVIPLFINQSRTGTLTLTDKVMTRFNITLDKGVDLVLNALQSAHGGEIIVPKLPSYRITDMATAIAPNCKHIITGIRQGEKLHEKMITSSDSYSTYDFDTHYAILQLNGYAEQSYRKSNLPLKLVPPGFSYNSATNSHFLSVLQLRNLIKKHIDRNFEPS